jgi:hypothetical protein
VTDGYDVLSSELRGHAARIDGLVDRLDQAISAAQTVSMPDGAYGIICQFLPPVINPLEQRGIEGIGAARSGMAEAATGVRDSAATYDTHEQTNARSFGDIRSALDGSA